MKWVSVEEGRDAVAGEYLLRLIDQYSGVAHYERAEYGEEGFWSAERDEPIEGELTHWMLIEEPC